MNKNMNKRVEAELDWTGTRHGVQKSTIRLDMALGAF